MAASFVWRNKMNYQVELLAPAGNMEAFKGAIYAGADAVYLGGDKFGARAYADNFHTEELVQCIRYAHLFGKKVYLTINTLMKQEELEELYDYVKPFYEAGLDAVIVQDFGAFQIMKRYFPDMELHASTQMTITGAGGTALLKEMGATRIVPAREMSLEEVKHMKAETGLEIECFIHGAMCYCYSGQCLFSSILGGRSGNRGRCAQPCRLPYSTKGEKGGLKECYPLSLKDMCNIEHIGELMEAGVDSFKIEGRMKKAEYAAGVTAIYRKYIDLKMKKPEKQLQFDKKDLERLAKLYIRSERQDGYYYKQNGKDMITLDSPAYSGSDENLLQRIREQYLGKELAHKVTMFASFFEGCEATLTVSWKELSVTVAGDVVEKAQKNPMTEDSFIKQLKKLGGTYFEVDSIDIMTDNLSFYSIKALNDLRRKAVLELQDAIIESFGLPVRRIALEKQTVQESDNEALSRGGYSILVSTKEQLQVVQDFLAKTSLPVSHVYLESEVLTEELNLNKIDVPFYVALPYVMRRKDETKLESLVRLSTHKNIKGFLIRNIEEYNYLRRLCYDGKIIADAGVYVWNKETLSFWKERNVDVTCPLELNGKEWKSVFGKSALEKQVYGYIPMMLTANCVSKTSGYCHHDDIIHEMILSDRYKKEFPVSCRCSYCYNVVFNSVPHSLHKDVHGRLSEVCKRIAFTMESDRQCDRILSFWEALEEGKAVMPPYEEYTTGHEKRGVE